MDPAGPCSGGMDPGGSAMLSSSSMTWTLQIFKLNNFASQQIRTKAITFPEGKKSQDVCLMSYVTRMKRLAPDQQKFMQRSSALQCCCELSNGLVNQARTLKANSESNREPERAGEQARESQREPE